MHGSQSQPWGGLWRIPTSLERATTALPFPPFPASHMLRSRRGLRGRSQLWAPAPSQPLPARPHQHAVIPLLLVNCAAQVCRPQPTTQHLRGPIGTTAHTRARLPPHTMPHAAGAKDMHDTFHGYQHRRSAGLLHAAGMCAGIADAVGPGGRAPSRRTATAWASGTNPVGEPAAPTNTLPPPAARALAFLSFVGPFNRGWGQLPSTTGGTNLR